MHAYRVPGLDAGGQRRRSSQMARCLGVPISMSISLASAGSHVALAALPVLGKITAYGGSRHVRRPIKLTSSRGRDMQRAAPR
jgi:hypothetical protein